MRGNFAHIPNQHIGVVGLVHGVASGQAGQEMIKRVAVQVDALVEQGSDELQEQAKVGRLRGRLRTPARRGCSRVISNWTARLDSAQIRQRPAAFGNQSVQDEWTLRLHLQRAVAFAGSSSRSADMVLGSAIRSGPTPPLSRRDTPSRHHRGRRRAAALPRMSSTYGRPADHGRPKSGLEANGMR